MSGFEPFGVVFGGVLAIIILIFIINIFFCLSLYSALKCVPAEKRVFPAWLVWLMLIPIVGIIFAWMMEPFGLPKSFEAVLADNGEAIAKTKVLFGLGLAHVILMTVALFPFLKWIVGIAALIVWIIYWVKVVDFKNKFLLNLNVEKEKETSTEVTK